MQELQYLNIAINNITRIENLHRCESLTRLDLTMNFVGKSALGSIDNLRGLVFLRELHLLGNPCTQWSLYRKFVIAMLPQLQLLDGETITGTERTAALSKASELQLALTRDSFTQDKPLACQASTANAVKDSGCTRRSWCPEARLAEHQEAQALTEEAERKQRSASSALFGAPAPPACTRSEFPSLKARP
ncbi:hypothetical protein CVIRNUC_007260 [Coccomyxa viridis]|uniref:Uncharacterized protein n=1 Tax=Coccomyxa viridis TaxID=1274662 RepID=A0AAV1IBH4_9CHLO|nr:hypothetical protein CVIRNUC_007260 [Coccomyxa viridis]